MIKISKKLLAMITASLSMLFCNSCTSFNTKEKIIVVNNPKYDLTKADVVTNEGLTENERMDYLIDSINKLTNKNDYIIFNGGINYHGGDTSEVKTFVNTFASRLRCKTVFLCGTDGFEQKQWERLGLQWNYLIETNKSQILCLSANKIHETNFDFDQIPSMFNEGKKRKVFITPWVYARKSGKLVESYFYEYSKDEKFLCVFSGHNLNHSINSQENYMTYRNRMMPIFTGGNFSFPFQNFSEYSELKENEYINYAWTLDVLEFYGNSCEYYMYQPERKYTSIEYFGKGKTHSLKLYEVNNFSIISGICIASGTVYLFIAIYPLRLRKDDEE